MFEDMVLSGKTKRTNKPWTVALSLAIQALLVGILILIPLIYTEALPKTMMATMLTAPPPPPPPATPSASRGGCAHQAASPLDGCRQTAAAERDSKGHQNY